MSYFGWSKDWFDKDGDPNVSEGLIKRFVNRYFSTPRKCQDHAPLIMFFVRCRFCGNVQQHYILEDHVNFIYNPTSIDFFYIPGLENFVYNHDNTYTSLSSEVDCTRCYLVWNTKLEHLWHHQPSDLTKKYENINPQFESPLEETFWTAWKAKCRIALLPQYLIASIA